MISVTVLMLTAMVFYGAAQYRLFRVAERRDGLHEPDLSELLEVDSRRIPQELQDRFGRRWALMFVSSPEREVEAARRNNLATMVVAIGTVIFAIPVGIALDRDLRNALAVGPGAALILGGAALIAFIWVEQLAKALMAQARNPRLIAVCVVAIVGSVGAILAISGLAS